MQVHPAGPLGAAEASAGACCPDEPYALALWAGQIASNFSTEILQSNAMLPGNIGTAHLVLPANRLAATGASREVPCNVSPYRCNRDFQHGPCQQNYVSICTGEIARQIDNSLAAAGASRGHSVVSAPADAAGSAAGLAHGHCQPLAVAARLRGHGPVRMQASSFTRVVKELMIGGLCAQPSTSAVSCQKTLVAA